MKLINNVLIKTCFFFLLALPGFFTVQAQERKNKEDDEKATVVSNLLNAKNFVFRPRIAHPMGGRTIQLTQDFDLRVSNDTIQSYLPYFGRAFSAPINPNEGGIRFTSTDFTYKQTALKKRKGGWSILIEPRDTRDVRQLILRIFENGSATLQVMSNNRQPISFTGSVEGRR